MSAWIVSKEHIDLLVRAALRGPGHREDKLRWWQVDEDGEYAGWRTLDAHAEAYPEEEQERQGLISPSRLGQILLNENLASVRYRYEAREGDDLPGPIDAYYLGPYVYADPGHTLTPAEVFRAIDCLDYQSCEHDGWRKSEAWQFLEALRHRVCRASPGYADAPWGWTASDLAAARAAQTLEGRRAARAGRAGP